MVYGENARRIAQMVGSFANRRLKGIGSCFDEVKRGSLKHSQAFPPFHMRHRHGCSMQASLLAKEKLSSAA